MPGTAAGGSGSGRKRWGWAALMAGAFLAGLLLVGVALIRAPETERTTGDNLADSPAAIPPSAVPSDNGAGGPAAGPRLAIVVDDLGYDPVRDAEWLDFPERITVSVIPHGPSSKSFAASARTRGFGVILHVPMEPEGAVADRIGAVPPSTGDDAGGDRGSIRPDGRRRSPGERGEQPHGVGVHLRPRRDGRLRAGAQGEGVLLRRQRDLGGHRRVHGHGGARVSPRRGATSSSTTTAGPRRCGANGLPPSPWRRSGARRFSCATPAARRARPFSNCSRSCARKGSAP